MVSGLISSLNRVKRSINATSGSLAGVVELVDTPEINNLADKKPTKHLLLLKMKFLLKILVLLLNLHQPSR